MTVLIRLAFKAASAIALGVIMIAPAMADVVDKGCSGTVASPCTGPSRDGPVDSRSDSRWERESSKEAERAARDAQYEARRREMDAAVAREDYREALRLAYEQQQLRDGPNIQKYIASLREYFARIEAQEKAEQARLAREAEAERARRAREAQAAIQRRQAEEERNAPIRRQAITESIEALTASIVGSARDSAERDNALSGLIGELEKTTADGCVFDVRKNCESLVVPKQEPWLRGTASLSAEVRQAMSKTRNGKKLLEEEAALRTELARADAEVAELKSKMEAAPSPAIREQLAVDYSKKDIERLKAKQRLDFKEFEVEKAADVTVVELRRRSDKR